MSESQTPSDRLSGDAEAGEILANLADLVVGMSRLLVELSAIEPFKNADFGLIDWVALSVLARGPVQNNKQLASVLGVTRQRANQIKTSLEEMRLISSTQSDEDARENVLIVTEAGHILLADINMNILAIMSASLKDRKRLLARANRSVRGMRRAVRTTRLQMITGSGPDEPKGERRGSASKPVRAGT